MAKNNKSTVPETLTVDDGMTEEITVSETTSTAMSGWGDYSGDHSAHTVKLKADEVIIPMLKIVQSSSKIFKNRGKAGVPECEEGDIYNSLTNEVYKDGVLLVPLGCFPCVIERTPSPAGLFVAKLETSDPRVQKAFKANGKDGWKKLKSDTKTDFHYTEEVPVGLIYPSNPNKVVDVALVPFSGTNVFPRRLWWKGMATAPDAGKTPYYAFRTKLTTVVRKGEVESRKFFAAPMLGSNPGEPMGEAWGRSRFAPNNESLTSCLQFLQLFQSGQLGKTDYSDVDSTASEDDAEKKALDNTPDF